MRSISNSCFNLLVLFFLMLNSLLTTTQSLLAQHLTPHEMPQCWAHFSSTSNNGLKHVHKDKQKFLQTPFGLVPIKSLFYLKGGEISAAGGLTIWLNNSLKFFQPWQARKYWLFLTHNKLEGQSIFEQCKKYSPWKAYLNILYLLIVPGLLNNILKNTHFVTSRWAQCQGHQHSALLPFRAAQRLRSALAEHPRITEPLRLEKTSERSVIQIQLQHSSSCADHCKSPHIQHQLRTT